MTRYTFMFYHPSFIFFIILSYWPHDTVTSTCSISRKLFVKVFWIQTKRTMISRASCRMFCNFLIAVFTYEWFVFHDKSHDLFLIWCFYKFCYSIIFFSKSISCVMCRSLYGNKFIVMEFYIRMMVTYFSYVSYLIYKIKSRLKALKFKCSSENIFFFSKVFHILFCNNIKNYSYNRKNHSYKPESKYNSFFRPSTCFKMVMKRGYLKNFFSFAESFTGELYNNGKCFEYKNNSNDYQYSYCICKKCHKS